MEDARQLAQRALGIAPRTKPPSTQMVVKRDIFCWDFLTLVRTCLPPCRSPTFAAVTKTRNTNPKVSTVINRLRPLIFLAESKPTDLLTMAALFTL